MKIIDMFSNFSMLSCFGTAEGESADTGESEKTGEKAVVAAPQPSGEQQVFSENADLSDAGTTTETDSRKEKFETLIKGEYKDLFDERMQKAIKERLKSTKEASRETENLLSLVADRYGVDIHDKEALKAAITRQPAKADSEETVEEKADKLYASWMESAKMTKEAYPDFDLQKEMQNERFLSLLRGKVDVKTAYEVLHKDEILPAAMEYAAKTVEEKLTNRMLAGAARPYENGNQSKSPAVMRSNVSGLSKKARQEIIRRVQKGEKIRF